MNINYYFHGLPKGFDFIGNQSEKDFFFQNFYEKIFRQEHANGNNGFNELRIEAIPQGSAPAYYYTYFIGKGINTCYEPRPGYLAVTIKLDIYYKKARNLMFLLDSFVHGYIVKAVLSNNQYRVNDFAGISQQVKSFLKNELEGLIEKTFNPEDLIKINVPGQRTGVKINLADANDATVEQAIRQYGEVSISDIYPSKQTNDAIKQKDQQIEGIKSSHNNEISQLHTTYQGQLAQRETEIEAIKKQQSGSKKQVSELTKQLNEAKEKLKKCDDKLKQIKNLVSDIPPSYGFSGNNPGGIPTNPGREDKDDDQHKDPWWDKWLFPALSLLTLLIIAGTSIFVYKSCFNQKENETEVVGDTTSIENDSIYENVNTTETKLENLRIDIQELSGNNDTCKVGDMIHVSLKSGNNPVAAKGKFVSVGDPLGLEISPLNPNGIIEVTIRKPGKQIIDFQDEQGKTLLDGGPRTIIVK